MPARTSNPVVIWRLLDGRAGHESQVRGLSEAMSRLQECECVDIPVKPSLRGIRSLLPGRFGFCDELPRPDFLIAAGHGTHLPLIRLQRTFGGRSVVIMRPSLPSRLFDVCVVPSHDRWSERPGVIVTEGALNQVRPELRRSSDCGVFLVGGLSRHFQWSDAAVLCQIEQVLKRSELPWLMITSQRTPASFHQSLRESGLHLRLKSADAICDMSPREVLMHCREAWVSCDSVSMIYEAITSGCRVGMIELPTLHDSRLSRNVSRLRETRLATSYSDWLNGQSLVSRSGFCEADDVAAKLFAEVGLQTTDFTDQTRRGDFVIDAAVVNSVHRRS